MIWTFECWASGMIKPETDIHYKTEIKPRTVDGWISFLKEKVDSENGNIELNVFMALCLGGKEFLTKNEKGIVQEYFTPVNGGVWTENYSSAIEYFYNGGVPTEKNAVDLMVAFLSTGDKIDMADWSWEGTPVAAPTTAILMAQFNKKYASQAIIRMTENNGKSKEFNNQEFEQYQKVILKHLLTKQGERQVILG